MTQYYEEYDPTFPTRSDWSSPTVLRERARRHPEKVYLDVPWANESFTYSETLDIAESVGSGMLNAGATYGDRVLIMIPNCSAYIFAWLGSSVAGLVEVPINTAYRGAFLAHQVSTTTPSIAVISPEYVERILDVEDAFQTVKHFYLVGEDVEVDKAINELIAEGRAASNWKSLLDSQKTELPNVKYSDLGSIFFTSGTTGLSKGVMMPQAHMYLFADETVSLTRLTEDDTYMSCGPLFHGNSQFLAAYPALIAGSRYVLQERFSASEWINQIRASKATVTNFIGVMM
ncbi:MAG: AMP-binding protein, partial [Actinomycetota bacterium]|nr:AMP-binding protein [Actinomycetota bacterium]